MKKSVAQPRSTDSRVSATGFENDRMIDFTRIDYLKTGNAKQQRAYLALTEREVFEKLRRYDPILTGTIPINIDIDTSDLDIICCFRDAAEFKDHLITCFSREAGFKINTPKQPEAVAASFVADGFIFEMYGQPIPSQQQAAYRHMLIEHRILLEKGEAFRQQVVALKKQGYKTEPAFGKLLGIEGDVYEKLLKFES